MKLNKSSEITLIIVVGAIILGLIWMNSGGSSYNNTISVSGQATIDVMPDLVSVYFNVDTQGATADEASDKNTEIVNALTSAMISLGFEESDLKTQGFSVYPEYNYPSNTVKGYRATHSLKIELPADSEKIGDVVSSGLDSGAGISYINFELTQESQNAYKAESMKLAAQDATSKAEAVAEGLDKSLGSLVSVSVDSYDYYPWMARDFSGGSVSSAEIKEDAASITPSEQQISSTVTAVFKIR